MSFDRFTTAGLILGLAAGIAAFSHGYRTAPADLQMVPQTAAPQPAITTRPNGVGVGP
jgi:hypothetical protein